MRDERCAVNGDRYHCEPCPRALGHDGLRAGRARNRTRYSVAAVTQSACCRGNGVPCSSVKGKRGGARVIYYYGGDHMPIFLIAIYAKNEKADLTAAEKEASKKLIETLNREYRAKEQALELRDEPSTHRRK